MVAVGAVRGRLSKPGWERAADVAGGTGFGPVAPAGVVWGEVSQAGAAGGRPGGRPEVGTANVVRTYFARVVGGPLAWITRIRGAAIPARLDDGRTVNRAGSAAES